MRILNIDVQVRVDTEVLYLVIHNNNVGSQNFPLPMTPKVKLGMLLNCHQLRGAFGEWNRADYPVLDQACPAP